MAAVDEGCALVTGASRGIGAAIARRLESDGWRVAGLSRNGNGDGRWAVDVRDADGVKAVIDDIEDTLGPVLVLVNNAGIREDGLALRMEDDMWQAVLDTNLTGAFTCTRRALRSMLTARWGRIVNISSVVAERGNPGQVNYAAAKAGLLGLTRTIAREMGSRNITCNAITPGVIETDMTAEGVADAILESVPAGRTGRPDEVAAAVSFLCSEDAAYVNGATIAVDGGLGA